jgi:hypothetical protein
MEIEIKESLISLLDGIKQADAARISLGMTRLEALLARGRGRLDPRLVHFLENRSYSKALLFLGGETDIPAGACGGKG